ncbi:hypothetical protein QWY14_04615 [Planococcus sp. N028]|uniref:Uncharacterized protein n=1 Tax=Planococcus shixiaomingii TaxID=3058393 RepID=A0ABT8MZL1_9BACL|nr:MULTISPECIES: hypothetical protein [unclassified Planococcus (in: firmicutes)]MDN7241059.1 hypothetical protein [Planococcus sp. N028]WKA53313.1 hypothetical protein QWY21_11635 [Planococcus sp. N022]
MEPRRKRINKGFEPDSSNTGLSNGVLQGHTMERKPSKVAEFLMQTGLFLLGGIILCGILYAVISYT